MFTIRTRNKEGKVTAFNFQTLGDLNTAIYYFGKTNAEWFAAEVKSADDTRGRIIRKETGSWGKTLSYNVKYGAYKDTVWGILGTEEWCRAEADKTNNAVRCWADVTASVEHIAGSLWAVVKTDPYKD